MPAAEREARTVGAQQEVAALGPFFAFGTHPAGSPPPAPWRPMTELSEDRSSVLRDRAEAVRGYLAAGGGRPAEAVEPRVGASVAQLGLVARLVSPAVGFAALYGRALLPAADDLWWQPVLGGGFPLSLPAEALEAALRQPEAAPPALADRIGAGLLEGPVRALVDAAAALSVSPRVLWGNVASAVNGAAAALAATAPGPVAGRARVLAGLLQQQPALRGASTAPTAGSGFRRRSCCLIYRAAPPGPGARSPRNLCGDCVLAA